jgi:hypothetical protein
MPNTWSHPTTWGEVCKRSSGRRKYHSLRRFGVRGRRLTVSRHLWREGLGYGVKARLARTVGVSKATITSDVHATLAMSVGDFSRRRYQGVHRVQGSLPPIGAAPSAPSPAALGVQVPWRSHHKADAS